MADIANEEDVEMLRGIFAESPEAFGKFFFPEHIKNKIPPFHSEIYNILTSGKKRIAIAAPRGHAKTTIVDLVYLSWMIVHKKVKFVLLISDTYSQAVLFLETIKAEVEDNERLKAFYGDLKTDKWSEEEIVVGETMVKALGGGMKVRGLKYRQSRPDLIICYDLENDELVESKERREKLERWFNGALIPATDKEASVVVIGTILHYDALMTKLVDKKQYQEFEKRIYKAIDNGKALWPEHLNLDELEKLRADYLAKGQGYLFYQEYLNDPVSSENQKFHIENFKYYEEAEIEKKMLNTYMMIDRAYSTAKTADFTGIVIVSVDQENIGYIRHAERFKGSEKALIDKIFNLRAYFKPKKVGIEQKAYQYTFKPTLDAEMRKRSDFFNVEELKDLGKSKPIRIESLLPRFESDSLFFLKKQTDLIDELLTFPKGVHDDLADALAYFTQFAQPPYNANINNSYYQSYGTSYRARKT